VGRRPRTQRHPVPARRTGVGELCRARQHLPGRTRRDPRRVAMDLYRHSVGPWPAVASPEDIGESLDQAAPAAERGTTNLGPERGAGLWSWHSRPCPSAVTGVLPTAPRAIDNEQTCTQQDHGHPAEHLEVQ
jgi:hypothetical protein